MTLEELRSARDSTWCAYRHARNAYENAIKATCKFQAGDIIRNADGKLAVVRMIFIDPGDIPVWRASALRKDGTVSHEHVPECLDEWRSAVLHKRPVATAS